MRIFEVVPSGSTAAAVNSSAPSPIPTPPSSAPSLTSLFSGGGGGGNFLRSATGAPTSSDASVPTGPTSKNKGGKDGAMRRRRRQAIE